jgi:hypothetical protein
LFDAPGGAQRLERRGKRFFQIARQRAQRRDPQQLHARRVAFVFE